MKADNKLMDIVLKIYEKIGQVSEKLDERISQAERKDSDIDTQLKIYNQVLIKNDLNLQEHMQRTAQVEAVILKHERYVSNIQFLISIIGIIATVVAVYSSLSSL